MIKGKGKWTPVVEIVLIYLAVSKIFSWFNTVVTMTQDDLVGVGEAMLNRFLSLDLPILAGVAMFYFLGKLFLNKPKQAGLLDYIKLYSIGYVGLLGLVVIITWATTFDSPAQDISWTSNLIYFTAGYIVVAIALNLKDYFKSKEAEILGQTPPARDADEKLAMLEALLEDKILTQEEFDQKKEKLLTSA